VRSQVGQGHNESGKGQARSHGEEFEGNDRPNFFVPRKFFIKSKANILPPKSDLFPPLQT